MPLATAFKSSWFMDAITLYVACFQCCWHHRGGSVRQVSTRSVLPPNPSLCTCTDGIIFSSCVTDFVVVGRYWEYHAHLNSRHLPVFPRLWVEGRQMYGMLRLWGIQVFIKIQAFNSQILLETVIPLPLRSIVNGVMMDV